MTALSTAQAALAAAHAAYEDARLTCKQLLAAREEALTGWNTAVMSLAAFTESATQGNGMEILTTGYDVRSEPVPPSPVTQVLNVRVSYTGTPGYSEITWKRVSNADSYVVERSPDPITGTSWEYVETVVELRFMGNGAIPGEKCWYRVAAVNRAGRGPWSEPALRPVM